MFGQIASMTPPGIDNPSPEDLWNLFKAGRSIRSLGKTGIFDLLRWGPMAAADFVSEFFDTELLRAVIAARGIFGCSAGSMVRGFNSRSVTACRCRCASGWVRVFPARRAWANSLALCRKRPKLPARKFAPAPKWQQIRTKDGAVTGVILADGEEIASEAVVSGVDPKRTFFGLLDPANLDPVFAVRMKNYRMAGNVAKVHLALGDLPNFPSLANAVGPDGFRQALSGRIHIGHEIDYLERAFDASKYGEISSAPYLDVTIPTLLDPSLAPEGKHVLSAYFQFAPYNLRTGNWSERRGELGEHRH